MGLMNDNQDDDRAARDARAASEALSIVRGARASIAVRAATPWWYPPAYGLGMGGLVASLALPNSVAPFATMGCALYLLVVYAVWRRVSGLGVIGTRPGRTRRIAIGIGLATAAFSALAILLRAAYPDGRVAIFGGVAVALIAARASVAWDRAWRAELQEEML